MRYEPIRLTPVFDVGAFVPNETPRLFVGGPKDGERQPVGNLIDIVIQATYRSAFALLDAAAAPLKSSTYYRTELVIDGEKVIFFRDSSLTQAAAVRQVLDRYESEWAEKTDLSFGEAIDYLKAGEKVTRSGWKQHGFYLVMSSEPFIFLRGDGQYRVWLPCHGDLLAEDWELVE